MVQGRIYALTDFTKTPIIIDSDGSRMMLINNVSGYKMLSADHMLNDGEHVIALETNGKRLMRYNREEGTCYYYEINCGKEEWGNYAASAIYENKIYIFPRYADEVIKVHLDTEKTEHRPGLSLNITYEGDNQQEGSCFWNGLQVDHYVWLFQEKGKQAVSYNLCNEVWTIYELPLCINECVHVLLYHDLFYILSAEGKIFVWNRSENNMELLADCNVQKKDEERFSRLAVTDKNIFVLPCIGKDIYIVDPNTKNIKIYSDYPKDFRYCAPETWSKYFGYCENQTDYYFAMRSANYILCVNKRNGKERWIQPETPCIEEYYDVLKMYSQNILDEKCWSLDELISCIKNDISPECRNQELAGRKIWNDINRVPLG